MYATGWCPYCARARHLLESKGVRYREIDVDAVAGARDEMRQRGAQRTSVPQIFIGERHIGGFDDMNALDRAGGLDPLLADVARA
ncbi:MAG: glutaredoxin 3 [Steroidobacteraceae bacterium]